MVGDSLKGRTALISGGSAGLGKAIALELASNGADIIIYSRHIEKLLAARAEIIKHGTNVQVRVVDAMAAGEVSAMLELEIKLDILINNVGGALKFGDFDSLSVQEWRDTMNLNFLSMVFFSRSAMPLLKKSPCGRIINISSLPAHQPGRFNPHYSAAKAAMLNLNKHLSSTLAEFNILVNAVCPGTMQGGAWADNVKHLAERTGCDLVEAEKEMIQTESKKSPLGRIAQLSDVAALVAFLCSDKAQFITGGCFNVDGGVTKSAW